MYKLAQKLLMPLLLINITTSANRWDFFTLIPIGQSIFWLIVILSLFIISRTPYRYFALILFFLGLIFGVFQVVLQSQLFEILKTVSLGIIFVITGAIVYGDNPTYLRKQLVIFLAISIPIMLLQISGAHSFFMSWNTEYGHDPNILSPEDYGKFNKNRAKAVTFIRQVQISRIKDFITKSNHKKNKNVTQAMSIKETSQFSEFETHTELSCWEYGFEEKEFLNDLQSYNFSLTEMSVIHYRLRGYKKMEIAEVLNVTPSRITEILNSIAKKMNFKPSKRK